MTTLGVCEHGPEDGSHFKKLFDKTQLMDSRRDIHKIDCLLLWGGTDVCPALYGEKPNAFNEAGPIPSRRDLLEWTLITEAVARGIPIIGVCRGAQLLCAFDGGTLAQDVGGHQHGHEIVTNDGETFFAQANHHQMMLPRKSNTMLASTLLPLHKGHYVGNNDAIINFPEKFLEPEVVYFPDIKAIGFQPHPEWCPEDSAFVQWCLSTVKKVFL